MSNGSSRKGNFHCYNDCCLVKFFLCFVLLLVVCSGQDHYCNKNLSSHNFTSGICLVLQVRMETMVSSGHGAQWAMD